MSDNDKKEVEEKENIEVRMAKIFEDELAELRTELQRSAKYAKEAMQDKACDYIDHECLEVQAALLNDYHDSKGRYKAFEQALEILDRRTRDMRLKVYNECRKG